MSKTVKKSMALFPAFVMVFTLTYFTPMAKADPVDDAIAAVNAAIGALPAVDDIVPGQTSLTGKTAFNNPTLLSAIGAQASGSGANAAAAAGIYKLIADAKALGATDARITNQAKFDAVVAKINEISNTEADVLDVYLVAVRGEAQLIRSADIPAGAADIEACTELPNTFIIGESGAADFKTLTVKNSTPGFITVGNNGALGGIKYTSDGVNQAGGRYKAGVNAAGVVIRLEHVRYDYNFYSVSIANGGLKLGLYRDDNRLPSFAADAKIHRFERDGSARGWKVNSLDVAAYTAEVAAYTGARGWDHELNIFLNQDKTRVQHVFVMANDQPDAYGFGELGRKFRFVKATATDAALDKYNVPAAVRANVRTIDAGLYDPTNFGAEIKKYPLVITMAGYSSGRSEQWRFIYYEYSLLAKADTQANFAAGAAYILYPRSNEHYGGPGWSANYNAALIQLIEDVIKDNPCIDARRIYITGHSMGGMMTWSAIQAVQLDNDVPFKFAAAAPQSGGGAAGAAVNRRLFEEAALPIWMSRGRHESFNAAMENLVRELTGYGLPEYNNDNARVTMFNTITNPAGYTPYQHVTELPFALNMIYNNSFHAHGGKTPTNYADGSLANGVNGYGTWPPGGEGSLEWNGPVMRFYGTIYDDADQRSGLGAWKDFSSFSNEGTFVDWLNMWRYDPAQDVIDAIDKLPAVADIVGENPVGAQVAHNDPKLLAAIGKPASGAGENAAAATGIHRLIARAKALGVSDADIANLPVFTAVLAKITAISQQKIPE